MTLEEHVEEFKREGFTVFEGFISRERVAEIRAILDPEFEILFAEMPDAPRRKIVPLLGHKILGPMLRDLALNTLMLDFVEMVMGPFVQLDSFEISGFPICDASQKGVTDRWHRDSCHLADHYAGHYEATGRKDEPKPYTPPLACSCLIYLQDMNEETGPFRMVPGSHLNSKTIPQSQIYDQHPEQRFLDLKAGDLIILHHEVLHAGTWNISEQNRYLISNYVCHFGLPHRDPFDLPLIRQIMEEARANNDRRTLRFFGEDDQTVDRQEEAWRKMVEEDKAARIASRTLSSGGFD